ncbi:MAG: LamG-like jellyroll fold domain-containing protein [Planctomycetota bacterium]
MSDGKWTYFICALALTALVGSLSACAAPQQGGTYSWQKPHAKVLPSGDLEWAPHPFEFVPGDSVRYIDFEGGDDAAGGRSKEQAWKHHPWDPNATGRAAQASGPHTYVFKRGVYYRGALYPDESGRPEDPIRLTSDPEWGEGEAVICGSEKVTGWQKGADHPDIPEAEKVWYVDLDFAPRNVWTLAEDGAVTRVKLARTPNWEVTNPDDIKSEWWSWKNPEKPFDNYIELNGSRRHLAFDKEHINTDRPKEYYENALLWTTKGWVMGSPFPTRVRMVDRERGALAFGGQWGGVSYKIIRGCRYYLEDKPHYLDEAGEFWFDKQDGGGRLYLRLPGDQDPNDARVEVAKRIHMIESDGMSHVHVSGLTFRFTNVYWNLRASPWWVTHESRDVEPACVRLLGSGRDIRVSNCRFEHVHRGVRLKAEGGHDAIDEVAITDNVFSRTDHGGIDVLQGGHWGVDLPPIGRLYDVRIMRNKLDHIGLRPDRFGQGQAVDLGYPQTLEVAGNVLDRLYSIGINVRGGKASGALTDRPMVRLLLHHNKVTDPLLNNDDFGGIETWQGGPAYVYNNVSGNPGGYRNWDHVLSPETEDRFGHAYYLDGAFKNYHFNNIAWGKSKGPAGPLANTSAFQEIHSYQNTFFNNTAYNFVRGSRRQAPQAGRNKFLANIWQGMGLRVFRHARPADSPAAGNEAHAGPQKSHFALETNAYERNVFHDVGEGFAVFEPSGRWHTTLEAFRKALAEYEPLADDVGMMADDAPLPNAGEHDFRPGADSPAREKGVRVFVPWSLYAMVGEWNFYPIQGDPTRIMDEHWYLSPYYDGRGDYHQRPMYPLRAVGIGLDDYVSGPLEDWTKGALKFNGADQYAVLSNEKATEPFEYEATYRIGNWATVTYPEKMSPGETYEVEIELEGIEKGMNLGMDLHWSKTDGSYAGFLKWGGEAKTVTGEGGPYVFTTTPPDKPDLGQYVLTIYVRPPGEDQPMARKITLDVPKGNAEGKTKTATTGGGQATRAMTASGPDLKSPQIHQSNFLVEAYFRTAPGHAGGTLARKMDQAGYSLKVNGDGGVTFAAAGPGASGTVSSRAKVNDGEWHHVIAEADRKAGTLTLYVDGEKDAAGAGVGPDVSLANDSDLYVGGTPEGAYLEGAFEFLRIARGTLADAKTTIEELHEWQFDGPFLRDFAGSDPVGQRDAGAIEARR